MRFFQRLIKFACLVFAISNTINASAATVSRYTTAAEPTDSLLPLIFPGKLTSDPIVSCDSLVAVIPFTRAGNLVLIQAKADTIEGNFILDTGAPGLVLNVTYFRDYPSTSATTADQGGITGNTSNADPTIISRFSFGAVRYSLVEADRINLGHIENNKGVRILGLLGLQLFKRFEMILDYERNLLFLHLISKKESNIYASEQLKDTALYNTFPITFLDNKLLTTAEMDGKKLKFLVDTGAESNVLDSRLPDKIFDNVTVTGRITLTGTGAKKTEALYGNIKNLKIGDLNISSLPVIVANLEKMCNAYDRCLDGMLGFDFLSLHKIGFNFVKRKMYIWK
ncbi:MAG: aspartyl protease family protein [Ferruginibacter sp.]|nr:aspartyl protease family protein [Ferruginibacter sp.]